MSASRVTDGADVHASLANSEEFMDALVEFMNQAYVAVAQSREKHGMASSCGAPVQMSEDERRSKLDAIVRVLEAKFTETASAEKDAGQMSGDTPPKDLRPETPAQRHGYPPTPLPTPKTLAFPQPSRYARTTRTTPWTPVATPGVGRFSSATPVGHGRTFAVAYDRSRSPMPPELFGCHPECDQVARRIAPRPGYSRRLF
ncbi:uncharacterized protein LOC132707244 [Cylas formicarius]|uniref:uncharacterized protein LOC132707244 n=1 Tax=Cylas formicarius TaxID=197179 RepID=UPI002958B8C0|nr:uncharacterized protein LOC132707244 [Cylas formicarius]